MYYHLPSVICRLSGKLPGLVFLLVTMLVISAPARSAEQDHELKNVLLLNSYHQGFTWTDDVTRGIVSALGPVRGRTRLYIEHMNT